MTIIDPIRIRFREIRSAVAKRQRSAAVVLLLGAGLAAGLMSSPDGVRAMQDEHEVAPQSLREVGATDKRAYAGEAKCLSCHISTKTAMTSGMGMAALNPAEKLAVDYRSMLYRDGNYKVTIEKQPGGLQMTADDGANRKSLPIRWIFGQGNSGQTFILEDAGKFYESRASYYTALNNLDLTIGHAPRPAVTTMAALGRPLPAEELSKCFSCHTSENVFASKLDLSKSHPGVTCENCHGPGSVHVENMLAAHRTSAKQAADIFNPGVLVPADMNDFCGSCHRTTRDVLNSGVRDIRNIRFQPYRLENSMCYDPSDPRITCIACHNPHKELDKSSLSYDDKCLACHSNTAAVVGNVKPAVCPQATKDCVTCHMPKLNLPGAHYAFTDHYIRVVQPNAPYPD